MSEKYYKVGESYDLFTNELVYIYQNSNGKTIISNNPNLLSELNKDTNKN